MPLLSRRALLLAAAAPAPWKLDVTQMTFGPKHHFFGYIGHVRNTPWNGGDRRVVFLETAFHDRMPRAADAANVVLGDTSRPGALEKIGESRAWNPQQGTMFYWNPRAADRELFFNDRDPKTNKVFTVLYDIVAGRRIREYRYDATPFANSGVAQGGGWFLGLNYARMARLRPVTGYPEAWDWTADQAAPGDDGIWIADIATGKHRLLVSFRQLRETIVREGFHIPAGRALFINHTLWNRDGTRIYFFVRGDFALARGERTDVPCTIWPDGSNLKVHRTFVGGHPEWERGSHIVGDIGGKPVLYDVDSGTVKGGIGDAEIFPKSAGDIALSPDADWIVNGYREGEWNKYAIYRRSDGSWLRTQGFAHLGWTSGDLRMDPAPTWNRASREVMVPGFDLKDKTRQMWRIRIANA